MKSRARFVAGIVASVLAMTALAPVAVANAAGPYDAVTSSAMNNLAQAMSFYDLVNGSYNGVDASQLSSWGYNNGSSTHISLYVENGGADFLAVGQDTHAGSAMYIFSTTAGVLDGNANSVTQSSFVPPVAPTAAGLEITDLAGLFDWSAMATAFIALPAQRICDELLFAPEQTHLNGTSLPDAYVACVAGSGSAAATGATAIQALVLSGFATAGVLAYLSLQNTTASGGVAIPTWVPPHGVTAPPASIPLPPKPQDWPDYTNIRKLSAKVASVNALPATIADAITDECEYMSSAAALSPDDECVGTPIFASGQQDVPEASNHDRDAILTNPVDWFKLNYRPGASNPSSQGWQASDPICQANSDPSKQCDEYPFFASQQGGGLATPRPNLRVINGTQNGAQGNLYQAFLGTCHVQNGDAFLNVPVPEDLSTVPTIAICNGH